MSIIEEKSLMNIYNVLQRENIAICPCCSVLASRFPNLTKFKCSHRCDGISLTYGISIMIAKDLIIQHVKFQIDTLNINTVI